LHAGNPESQRKLTRIFGGQPFGHTFAHVLHRQDHLGDEQKKRKPDQLRLKSPMADKQQERSLLLWLNQKRRAQARSALHQ
jgi:hypothetical protein